MPEQADISDVSRFESWRAHHLSWKSLAYLAKRGIAVSG